MLCPPPADPLVQVWDHGGFAPEVDKRYAAKDHVQLMEDYLATSPNKRYVDLSWNTCVTMLRVGKKK